MKHTKEGKKVIKRLREGVDLTVHDVARLSRSFPGLIDLLEEVWCKTKNPKTTRRRFEQVRVGTLYLTKDGRYLDLKLRFSMNED